MMVARSDEAQLVRDVQQNLFGEQVGGYLCGRGVCQTVSGRFHLRDFGFQRLEANRQQRIDDWRRAELVDFRLGRSNMVVEIRGLGRDRDGLVLGGRFFGP
ncbi:MAG: hypothetical protein ACREJ2_14610 [Planctomycetota bacterium]